MSSTFYPTIDLFHFLTNTLSITPESKKLQKMFERYEKEHPDNSYLNDMEDFAELLNDEGEIHTINTYDDDALLSQVIQYVTFEKDDKNFVILQIHGGADVRGGYTAPYIFEVLDPDTFQFGVVDIEATTRNGKSWYTDDGGSHWYSDDEGKEESENGYPITWDIKEDGVFYKPTGEPINFSILGLEGPQWWQSNQRLVAKWAPELDPKQTTLKNKKRLRA
ncbi:MAG: hypothetical protein QXL94_00980 [Candidatus Parvarchaeum sp.]